MHIWVIWKSTCVLDERFWVTRWSGSPRIQYKLFHMNLFLRKFFAKANIANFEWLEKLEYSNLLNFKTRKITTPARWTVMSSRITRKNWTVRQLSLITVTEEREWSCCYRVRGEVVNYPKKAEITRRWFGRKLLRGTDFSTPVNKFIARNEILTWRARFGVDLSCHQGGDFGKKSRGVFRICCVVTRFV